MKVIEVDLEVFKELTNQMQTAEDSYSDVIKRLLRLVNAAGADDQPVGLLNSPAVAAPGLHSVARPKGLINQAMSREAPHGSGLGLISSVLARTNTSQIGLSDLRIDLPSGTELRANYKGKEYIAHVVDGRTVELNGVKHSSLSGAAMSITASPVSGYAFWRIYDPKIQKWLKLSEHRKQK